MIELFQDSEPYALSRNTTCSSEEIEEESKNLRMPVKTKAILQTPT